MVMLGTQLPTQVVLTKEVAFKAIHDFFRDKPFVFLGTGMSCSLDSRFGMPALRDELLRSVVPDPQVPSQVNAWQSVRQSLQDGGDLESALDNITDSALLQKITVVTGRFIANLDREHAFRIARREAIWPAARLIKRLVDTLPEGDRTLHVLTPNYDMLLEHSCDSAGVPYTAGFCGGVQRKADWAAVEMCLVSRERVCQRGKLRWLYKPKKHIRLHKVHGSLNHFFHDQAFVENNAWMWDPPNFAQRVLITPGLSKYQTLQQYRQELLKSADAAIDKASHFLFLGYGFNDTHLEAYIRRKLIAQGCKGLIVTRDSNPRIETLLGEANHLWLVCRSQNAGSDGTQIQNRRYPGGLDLSAQRLWDISEFTTEFFGD